MSDGLHATQGVAAGAALTLRSVALRPRTSAALRPGTGKLPVAQLPAPASWPAERQLWARGRAQMEASRPWRSTPDGSRRSYQRLLHAPLERLLAWVLKLSGLGRRGCHNALDVRLNRIDIPIVDLPVNFEGYRILHVTDPHFDMDDRIGPAICRAVAGQEVDLCVMTGDYRAADSGRYTQILGPMAALVDTVVAKDGVYATLGNHDGGDMVDDLESLGLSMLINETLEIDRGGQILTVTGLDDVNHYYTPRADIALQESAENFGSGRVGLALVHSAEMADEAAALGYSMYLCGHTHGGQICLPGGRPVLTNLTRNRGLATGLWQRGGMLGYTSSGAGVSGVVARFFSRAEVTLFTLRRAN